MPKESIESDSVELAKCDLCTEKLKLRIIPIKVVQHILCLLLSATFILVNSFEHILRVMGRMWNGVKTIIISSTFNTLSMLLLCIFCSYILIWYSSHTHTHTCASVDSSIDWNASRAILNKCVHANEMFKMRFKVQAQVQVQSIILNNSKCSIVNRLRSLRHFNCVCVCVLFGIFVHSFAFPFHSLHFPLLFYIFTFSESFEAQVYHKDEHPLIILIYIWCLFGSLSHTLFHSSKRLLANCNSANFFCSVHCYAWTDGNKLC